MILPCIDLLQSHSLFSYIIWVAISTACSGQSTSAQMAVACGAHIIFPPLEDPSFHCGHCLNAVFLCSCCGVQQGKDYVLAG